MFLALALQDEHINVVVVRGQPLRSGRGQVARGSDETLQSPLKVAEQLKDSIHVMLRRKELHRSPSFEVTIKILSSELSTASEVLPPA